MKESWIQPLAGRDLVGITSALPHAVSVEHLSCAAWLWASVLTVLARCCPTLFEAWIHNLIFSHRPQITPSMPEFLVWVQYTLPSPYTTRPGVEPQSECPSGDFSVGGSTCPFLQGVFIQEHASLSHRFTIVESQKRMGWDLAYFMPKR